MLCRRWTLAIVTIVAAAMTCCSCVCHNGHTRAEDLLRRRDLPELRALLLQCPQAGVGPYGSTLYHVVAYSDDLLGAEAIALACPNLDPNSTDRKTSEAPLETAARRNSHRVASVLLRIGARWERAQGLTPFHIAAAWGSLEVMKVIHSHGCPVDLMNSHGSAAPLHLAALNGNNSIVAWLISLGADVNSRTASEAAINPISVPADLSMPPGIPRLLFHARAESPLHLAAKAGHTDVARMLIRAGAIVDIRDGLGRTPLMIAASNNHDAIMALLVNSGANIELRDSQGNTAANYATTDATRGILLRRHEL